MGVEASADTETMHVGADVHAPVRLTVTVTGMDDLPVNIQAELELRGSKYVVRELTATRKSDGGPITGESLRAIPVQRIVRGAVEGAVQLHLEGSVVPPVLNCQEIRGLVAQGPTDVTLRWVARTFLIAQLSSDPPAKTVRDMLDIPMSTAGYWIRRAKDKGLIPERSDASPP